MNLKYRPIHIVEPTPCSHIRTINDSCASEEQQWRNWGKLPGSRRITQRYILIRWSKNTFLYTDLKIHCAFRPMILTKRSCSHTTFVWSKFWHKRGNLWQPWGRGAGIAQWLEHRTRDWKVAGSNPCWNGGRFSSPGSTFCADSYFGIRSTPCYHSST